MALEQTIKQLRKDVKKLIATRCDEKFDADTYGAVDLDPGLLVILVIVKTDAKKHILASDATWISQVRESLIFRNYPSNAIDKVIVAVESQETVYRESRGDWHLHLQ